MATGIIGAIAKQVLAAGISSLKILSGGTLDVAGTLDLDGTLDMSGAAVTGGGAMRLYGEVGAVGNVGAGEDDLMSYTIPAGTLSDHDEILVRAVGINGANTVNHTVKSYVNGQEQRSLVSNGNNEPWVGEIRIMRISATSVRVWSWISYTGNGVFQSSGTETVSDLDSNGLAIKFTGEDAGSNDNGVVQHALTVDHITPAATP